MPRKAADCAMFCDNSFLALSAGEIDQYIQRLLRNSMLRARMGPGGDCPIEDKYAYRPGVRYAALSGRKSFAHCDVANFDAKARTMKTIGMLGGMSWESSAVYYQILNREVQKRLGGIHSAKTLMHSCDFAEMAVLQNDGRWDEAHDRMSTIAVNLANSGADFLMICCNTMHTAAEQMERAARIPLLHIADPLGEALKKAGAKRPALLGSRFTMTRDDVLLGRLKTRFGIAVMVPEGEDFAEVNRVIYEECTRGQFLPASRANYRAIIARLVAQGADSVILGCTELPLLVQTEDSSVPLFDTTTLHAMAAVEKALA
jgi:amino-acid racemase